jgi:hypothetical protein
MRVRRRASIVVLLVSLAGCTAEDVPEPGGRPESRPASSDASTSTSPSSASSSVAPTEPAARPGTEAERIRAVLRDRTPDADEVISLARTPYAWTRGGDTVLVEYGLFRAYGWPDNPSAVAVQVLDRRGRVVDQWAETATDADREYRSAGPHFVWMAPYRGPRPFLMRDGTPVPLTFMRGARTAGPGDLRFGQGWLLNEDTGTVTQERLHGCRSDTVRTDRHGRVWCLDGRKKHLSFSDDGGLTWTRHTLSDSYFEYCDGGALGADVLIQDDAVAVALYRADFSLDRGRSWHDVNLPLAMIGSRPATGGSEADCTFSGLLADGRLVIGHFGDAVATDPSNTRFAPVRTPPGTRYLEAREGVMVAASRRLHGQRFESYDGGDTWEPVRLTALLRHLLPRPRGVR